MPRLVFLIALFLAYSLPLNAQNADQIISRYVEAIGGLERLKTVQSVRRTEFIDSGRPAKDKSITIKKRGGKFRSETSLHLTSELELNLVQGCDGRVSWSMTSQGNPSSGNLDCEILADIDGPLVDYSTKGNVIKLVGRKKIEGKQAYDLKLTSRNKKGHPAHFYVDTQTFLLVKILVQTDTVYQQDILSDYRGIDGIMAAFCDDMTWWPIGQKPPRGDQAQVLKAEKDRGHQKQTLEKIEFNIPVDDSMFVEPVTPSKTAPNKQP